MSQSSGSKGVEITAFWVGPNRSYLKPCGQSACLHISKRIDNKHLFPALGVSENEQRIVGASQGAVSALQGGKLTVAIHHVFPYEAVGLFLVYVDFHLIVFLGQTIVGIHREHTRHGEIGAVGGCEERVLARCQRFDGCHARRSERGEGHVRHIGAHWQRVDIIDAVVHLVDCQRVISSIEGDGIGAIGRDLQRTLERSERNLRQGTVVRVYVRGIFHIGTARSETHCQHCQQNRQQSQFQILHIYI